MSILYGMEHVAKTGCYVNIVGNYDTSKGRNDKTCSNENDVPGSNEVFH